MGAERAFLGQPSAAYRDLRIAFTLPAPSFAIPAVSYLFTPELASAQLSQINALLAANATLFLGAHASIAALDDAALIPRPRARRSP